MCSLPLKSIAPILLAFSVAICFAKSGEWWEKIPVAAWSIEQVSDFLNTSPWIGGSQGYFRQGSWVGGTDGNKRKAPIIMVYYQARILTARPVREAFLQLSILNPVVVTARSIRASTAEEELQIRMQELLASYPNDLLVRGDELHLILAVSQKISTIGASGARSEQEVFQSDELSDVDQSTIVLVTSLSTDTGKRVELENYEPPGTGKAGAMYYFPKSLPDGTPLVTAGDKDLLFDTVINKKQVKIKYDLGKLKYKGKREI